MSERDVLERARILLADDHGDFLTAVTGVLNPHYEVVGAVSDGQAALNAAKLLGPDVLVLDISMPNMTGIETARQIKVAGSVAKIVFLTVHEDDDYVRGAFEAGAQAYVVKSRLVTDLPLALLEVLAGRTFVSPFKSNVT
jgi:DNA-binding NarL/FixJ family response regulator